MVIKVKYKNNFVGMDIPPQTFNDNREVAFDDFHKYHNSFSSHKMDMEATSAMINNFNETFTDAGIPQIDVYRPDLNISDAERREMEIKSQSVMTDPKMAMQNEDITFAEKKKFIQQKINKYLSNIPPSERNKYNGYEYFFEKQAEAARKSAFKLAKINKFSTSGTSRFLGTLTGGMQAGFTDPLILGTLPISIMTGGGPTFASTILRTSAIEAVLAFGATTAIESQVLPFKKSVGIDYSVADAARVILLSTLAGAALPAVFLGSAKGIQMGYTAARQQVVKGVAELNPDLKAKLFVEENFSDEEFIKYFAQNIKNLKPNELVVVLETLNPTALTKPKVQEALNALEDAAEDAADMPLPNTPDGTLEHIRRMEASADALRHNEQPRILDKPTNNVVLKDKRPVAYDTYLRPDQILFDAETFQFKTGGDNRGVKDTLAKVTQWDRDAAGSLMVFQKEDGTYFVADGHQRLGLAKRLAAADPKADISINTTVRRELDGFTPEEVMAEAMIRNVQNGTADAIDVARALRISPDYIKRMQNKVAPNSSLYKYSTALYKLSNDAWGYFINNNVNTRLAAAVGTFVDDVDLQLSVLRILEKTNPTTDIEIRSQISSVLEAGSRNVETIDMFGTSTIKESLIIERGKVLKGSLDKLKKDKTVMATLIQNEQRIIQDGKNKLDTSYNRTQEEQNAVAIYQIETLANRKGDVSDALTRSAKIWADGDKRKATETFIEAVRDAIERGDTKGISASGDRRSAVIEGSSSDLSKIPEPTVREKSLANFDDPNNLKQSQKNADQEVAALVDELEISSNNPELVRGGAIKTSPTVKSSEASSQVDLDISQATGLSPSSSVFASANTTPLSRIDPTISIGDFNPIFKRVIVQPINDVNKLMQFAKQYKTELKTTLKSLSEDLDNVKVKVRVKKLDTVNSKIAKKLKRNNGDATTIPDYLAGRITVSSLEDTTKMLRKIQDSNIKIVDLDNYFIQERNTGYRAIHMQLVTQEGFSMEVQIHHIDLLNAFTNGSSYRKYKNIDDLTPEQAIDKNKLLAEDTLAFNKAYEDIKTREGVLDDIDDVELVIGEKINENGEIVNVTTTLKKFTDDIENDKKIISELIMRECI